MNKKTAKSIGLIILMIFLSAEITLGAEPIKIGIVWPLTGPIAAAGSYLAAGAKIAAERINSQGGMIGRPIELIIEDGANDPAQSVSAAEKLVTRDKIDLFMGAWGSSPTLAVSASVTKKYGIPHIAETASSVKVTNLDGKRPNPWLFRISPHSEMDARNSVPLFPKMGFNKVALLLVNTDWGRGSATIFPEVTNVALAAQYYYFYSSSVGSYSREDSLSLCSNGMFGRKGETYASQQGQWGVAGQTGYAGSWTADGDGRTGTIVLTYRNGRAERLRYQKSGLDIILDGKKYGRFGDGSCSKSAP